MLNWIPCHDSSVICSGRSSHDGCAREEDLEPFVKAAFAASPEHPVLLDRFLEHAVEIDVDLVCDGTDVYIGGVMEHVEEAGIHSGDSACSIPPYTLSDDIVTRIKEACCSIALELGVKGLMNAQIAVKGDEFYIIEVNPRARVRYPMSQKQPVCQWRKSQPKSR